MGQRPERKVDVVGDLVELVLVVLAWAFLFWGEPKSPLTAGPVIAGLLAGGIAMFFELPVLVKEKPVSVNTLVGACLLLAVSLAIVAVVQVGLSVQWVRIFVAVGLLVVSLRLGCSFGITFHTMSEDRKQLDSAARRTNDEPTSTE